MYRRCVGLFVVLHVELDLQSGGGASLCCKIRIKYFMSM